MEDASGIVGGGRTLVSGAQEVTVGKECDGGVCTWRYSIPSVSQSRGHCGWRLLLVRSSSR